MKNSLVVLLLTLMPAFGAWAVETRDVLGASHLGGRYNFTSSNYLNEGADRIRSMGSRVIKIGMGGRKSYAFNNQEMPAAPTTLVEIASSAPYQRLFQKDFTTFIIIVEPPVKVFFHDGLTQAESDYEYSQMNGLAQYLIQTYAGSNKTFVLQNWEGDWLLSGQYNATGFNAMKQWLTRRQQAVTDARTALPLPGVTVLHAAEVNLVRDAMVNGVARAVNSVLPGLNMDLYSYSSWEGITNPADLISVLDYMSVTIGKPLSQIYLGEFGIGENEPGVGATVQRDVVRNLTYAAIARGLRYVVYWQIFCNEQWGNQTLPPSNSNMRGLWLVRVDNTTTPLYTYISEMCGTRFYRVALRNKGTSKYMSAVNGGGDIVNASSTLGAYETLTLIDVDGWDIVSGNTVHLLAPNGMFILPDNGGGSVVRANNLSTGGGTHAWAFFTLTKIGSGSVVPGSEIALAAYYGQDVVNDVGATVSATGTRPGGVIATSAKWYFTPQ